MDFYNHDSKQTDAVETFDPVYNTLFSFKNQVDDFYIQFLDKEFVLVEVYALPLETKQQKSASGLIRLGQAKLPLCKLLQGDYSFQVAEIVHHSEKGEVTLGKLFYRMRMRKSLDKALSYYRQFTSLKNEREK